jgi:hypothetical protein
MASADPFRGTWALVTGASSGIGEEFARQLADLGAHLLLVARSAEKLEALAAELRRSHDVEAHALPTDLTRADQRRDLAARLTDLGYPVDHLINNAGFGSAGPFVDSEAHRQLDMVRLNCEALVELCHELLPGMLQRRSGGIINVASTAAYQPVPFMATYAATKAFVFSFGAALAEETRASGVRVLTLCPGPVPTGFQAVADYDIKSERFAVLSATETVEQALTAYAAGKSVCVPGAVNRVGTLASKFLPQKLVTRAVGAGMRRNGRARS